MAQPAIVKTAGSLFRRLGQRLDALGASLQGADAYVESLVPPTRTVPFKSKAPTAGSRLFVAPTASVVGDVKLGEQASAWYGAVIKGDRGSVTIGRNSAVMDNAYVAASASGKPVTLGADVTISPGATVLSATIGEGTMVGMGAKVLPGAVVGADCFIDAGAVVPAGTVIPPGQLWTGVPARHLRNLGPAEMAYLRSTAATQAELASAHASETSRSVEQVEADAERYEFKLENGLSPDEALPEADPDVAEYYKLTANDSDKIGLFRVAEYDVAAETAAREAEEAAADAAEAEYCATLERTRRVGAAVRLLAETRADRASARDKVVADLAARDPQGAVVLRAVLEQVSSAVAAGTPEAKESVVSVLEAMDPTQYLSAADAKAAAESAFSALAKHTAAGALTAEVFPAIAAAPAAARA